MKRIISIGTQDFAYLRENNYFYIDKTGFIKEWWENGDNVTLITRPRRFGKTLNMSMVEMFFSNQYAGRQDLFEGLSIWKEEKYRELQGTYPVISLSFASVKGKDYQTTRKKICQILTRLYSKYNFLQAGGLLDEKELDYFHRVSAEMDDSDASVSLNFLSDFLSRYYGKHVIILLDEYDTPLQEAYVGGYWDELVSFIRSLFNAAFKTNPYMERAILTGITRVSKESIFSDLNNLAVITTTTERYAAAFGFTEQEVFEALDDQGMPEWKDSVKEWYDGFNFGGHSDIYNPWSITSFLKEKKLKTYWANTSENSLVGRLIQSGPADIKVAMEDLMEGKQIETSIDEEIVFSQLDYSITAIWSLLLASGYLRVDEEPKVGLDDVYHLSLTNFEVKRMFRNMINGWFKNANTRYNDFIKALMANDLEYMNEYMNQIAMKTFSYFDTGKMPSENTEPERFYHGFVLGLIVDLSDQYRIISNRESGLGRYDVMLEPKTGRIPAYIIEFKVRKASEKDLSETVREALKQIDDMNYDAELIARGIPKERIRHYGFAFEGKKVLIG
ncbi:MAG: AAA family ATPase [Eubacteriales bacterium]|nr:AAA family ATPase [Eubacteriales bacterium]